MVVLKTNYNETCRKNSLKSVLTASDRTKKENRHA